MEIFEIAIIVAGLILLGFIIYCYVKNKNFLSYSNIFSPILKALYSLLVAIGNASPKNATLTTVVTVIKAAIDATGCAEQLWLQGELDKSARPEYARQFVTVILSSAGIEVTDAINTIIQGAIAMTCYLLPHHTVVENKEGEE